MTKPNPFRYFQTSPEIIRIAVMLQCYTSGFRFRFEMWRTCSTNAGLKSATKLFGIGGIGFSIDKRELARVYGGHYDLTQIVSVAVDAGLKGIWPAQEIVWLLR